MAIALRRFAEKSSVTISRAARLLRSPRWPIRTRRSRFKGTPLSEASRPHTRHCASPRGSLLDLCSRAWLVLDVICDLLHGRKPYAGFRLDVRDQPIELHDPR